MKTPLDVKMNINEHTPYEQLSFKAFEVNIGISSNELELFEEISKNLEDVFPNGFQSISRDEVEFQFSAVSNAEGAVDLYKNDKKVVNAASRADFLDYLKSQLRVTIAEFADSKVFLHAGVVGWKGRAIVIPAKSFGGKTTLVAELVKKGAIYYSDEFAILDAEGNVQPYPKMLSLRGIIDEYKQVDYPVEEFGGIAGSETIPVGMVLITEYKPGKKTPKKRKPMILSRGQGIMEILPHTVPLRNNPKFALEVLNKLASRVIIVKIARGEAMDFADWLLNYFETEAV